MARNRWIRDTQNGIIYKVDRETGELATIADATILYPMFTELTYAQKDFDLDKKYGVSGSPTLILNGNKVSEFDFGGRSADAVKTLLCCGFNNEPDICNTNVTAEQAATSFSETYSKGGSSSGGSC